MARIRFVVSFSAAVVLAAAAAQAQCRGSGGGQGTAGSAAASLAGLTGGGSQLLTGPGSLAYQAMMSQMVAQQMAQHRMLLAQQQAQVRQEKLAQRRYRAEQRRSELAESRTRARAALAVKSGLATAVTPPNSRSLAAYQPRR